MFLYMKGQIGLNEATKLVKKSVRLLWLLDASPLRLEPVPIYVLASRFRLIYSAWCCVIKVAILRPAFIFRGVYSMKFIVSHACINNV